MDTHPTAANSKFPLLRRPALHFLALLVRAYTMRAYSGRGSVGSAPVQRAKDTLGYIAVTDVDSIVRIMALEVCEAIVGLERAMVGLCIEILCLDTYALVTTVFSHSILAIQLSLVFWKGTL